MRLLRGWGRVRMAAGVAKPVYVRPKAVHLTCDPDWYCSALGLEPKQRDYLLFFS